MKSIKKRRFLRFIVEPQDGGGGDPKPVEGEGGSDLVDDPPNEGGEDGLEGEGEKVLGDAGKQALNRMKTERNTARKELRDLRAELDALKAKAEGREAEFEQQKKQREVEEAALTKANTRIAKAEIKAIAAKKLSDPSDALLFINPETVEVGEDGEIDSEAISGLIDELLEKKPYLAAQGGKNHVFESPGSHRDPGKSQLTHKQVHEMTADQINAARAEGRLNDLLGIK